MWLNSKTTTAVVVVVLCLVAGLALGELLASVIGSVRDKIESDKKVETTKLVLQSMGTLQVGDTLANHQFEDLDGAAVQLSDVIHGSTWIAIIEPTCESCVEDMRNLKARLTDPSSSQAFVFISASNPRYLRDLKDEICLRSAFLYDHRRTWSNRYDFYTYPFHLRVDRSLGVLEVVAGALSPEQIESVLEL